jgi:hypothetical protein
MKVDWHVRCRPDHPQVLGVFVPFCWRALAKCCQHADVGVEASRRSREHSRTRTTSGICNDVEQTTMTVPWTGSFSWNIAGYLAEYQSFH